MGLLGFMTVITTLGVVVTSSASVSEGPKPAAALSSRYGVSCIVGNRVHRHGAIFTIGATRCIKYRCNDGSYHFYQEGCDKWGRCWPANQTFDYECRRYTCRASYVGGGFKSYAVLPLSGQNCKDRFNQCQRPGVMFEYVMKGYLKRRCSCRPGGKSITYYCYD